MIDFVDLNFILYILFSIFATYFLVIPLYKFYKKEKDILNLEDEYTQKLETRKNLVVI